MAMRALSREPDQRWASARRLAEELAWFQARWGCGLLRSRGEEPNTGSRAISDKHRIDGLLPDTGGSGLRRRA